MGGGSSEGTSVQLPHKAAPRTTCSDLRSGTGFSLVRLDLGVSHCQRGVCGEPPPPPALALTLWSLAPSPLPGQQGFTSTLPASPSFAHPSSFVST